MDSKIFAIVFTWKTSLLLLVKIRKNLQGKYKYYFINIKFNSTS